jgi:uncharacterized protein YPO0396
MTDSVPHAVRDLLAFYAECHPEARFGDLDIGALQCTVKSIEEAAKKVISAEEAVAQSREQFRSIEAEMTVKAGRILSFLKIHVEGDDVQLARLEAISNAMPSARRKTKTSADATPIAGETRQRHPRKSKNSADASGDVESGAKSAIEVSPETINLPDDHVSELGNESSTPVLARNKPGSKSAALGQLIPDRG